MTVAEPGIRVMHVITSLQTGGAETALAGLLLHGSEVHGPKVHSPGVKGSGVQGPMAGEAPLAVSLLPGGAVAERLGRAGIPVRNLAMTRGRASLAGVARLVRLIRRTRPHVIQSWMYHADLLATFALLASGRRRRTRLVWGVRCSDMDTSRYGPGLRRVIATLVRLSRFPDAVVANSEAGRRVHLGLGYRPRRFEVIPNGIDTGRFRPDAQARAALRNELGIPSGTPLLAHLARRDPMKDHETFLAALDRLPGVSALAAGEGTEGLPERPGLFRLGPRRDAPGLLAACDLVVSSSAFGEGFSNAIAEGMASGLPAVATEVGDARIIVGETGRIVPPREPEALAEAIRALLSEDPARRAERGRQARARIEGEFSLARCAAAFDALHSALA